MKTRLPTTSHLPSSISIRSGVSITWTTSAFSRSICRARSSSYRPIWIASTAPLSSQRHLLMNQFFLHGFFLCPARNPLRKDQLR